MAFCLLKIQYGSLRMFHLPVIYFTLSSWNLGIKSEFQEKWLIFVVFYMYIIAKVTLIKSLSSSRMLHARFLVISLESEEIPSCFCMCRFESYLPSVSYTRYITTRRQKTWSKNDYHEFSKHTCIYAYLPMRISRDYYSFNVLK